MPRIGTCLGHALYRLSVLIASAICSSPALAVTFDDGVLNVIDASNSYALESVSIENGPSGTSTIVQVVEGGQVGTALAPTGVVGTGFSILLIEGGIIHGPVTLNDAARVTVTGGEVDGLLSANSPFEVELLGGRVDTTLLTGTASLRVQGATVDEIIAVSPGGSEIEMFSGNVARITLDADSRLNLFAGEVMQILANGTAQIIASGGEIPSVGDAFAAGDQVRVTITGGTYEVPLLATGESDWRISGGSLSDVMALDHSTVSLRGFGFDRPFGDVADTSGRLSGTLADCSPVSVDYVRDATASLSLVPDSSPQEVAVGEEPWDVKILPGQSTGLVAHIGEEDAVSRLSLQSCALPELVPVSLPPPNEAEWRVLAVDVTPDAAIAVIGADDGSLSSSGRIVTIDLATGLQLGSIPVSHGVESVAVSPSGETVVAAHSFGGPGHLHVAQVDPLSFLATHPIDGPVGDLVFLNEETLLVYADAPVLYSLPLARIVGTITPPADPQLTLGRQIAVAPATSQAVISTDWAGVAADGISIVDLATRTTRFSVQLANNIGGVDITLDGQRIVASTGGNVDELWVVDRLPGDSVRVKNYTPGFRPGDVAISAEGSTIFYAMQSADRVGTLSLPPICRAAGERVATTPSLMADQDNYCEQWVGLAQPGADLSRSMIARTNLSLSDLSGSLLIDANLAGADLTGANLGGADVSGASLTGSLYDEATVFPSGSGYSGPEWGLPEGRSPWSLEMIPVPAPAFETLLLAGLSGLAALASKRRCETPARRARRRAPHGGAC